MEQDFVMFENFQTKKLKEELVSQENGVLETQTQSFCDNQCITSLDGIERSTRVKAKHATDFCSCLTLDIAILVVFGLKPNSKIGRNAWKIGT